jgi:hypothetical protein
LGIYIPFKLQNGSSNTSKQAVAFFITIQHRFLLVNIPLFSYKTCITDFLAGLQEKYIQQIQKKMLQIKSQV